MKRIGALALQHFRSAFVDGDNNYEAQYWYARELFLAGDHKDSVKRFGQLSKVNLSASARNKVRGIVFGADGRPARFTGAVTKREATYLFVSSDSHGIDVFAHEAEANPAAWGDIHYRDKITFELGFSLRGPVAINPRKA